MADETTTTTAAPPADTPTSSGPTPAPDPAAPGTPDVGTGQAPDDAPSSPAPLGDSVGRGDRDDDDRDEHQRAPLTGAAFAQTSATDLNQPIDWAPKAQHYGPGDLVEYAPPDALDPTTNTPLVHHGIVTGLVKDAEKVTHLLVAWLPPGRAQLPPDTEGLRPPSQT